MAYPCSHLRPNLALVMEEVTGLLETEVSPIPASSGGSAPPGERPCSGTGPLGRGWAPPLPPAPWPQAGQAHSCFTLSETAQGTPSTHPLGRQFR